MEDRRPAGDPWRIDWDRVPPASFTPGAAPEPPPSAAQAPRLQLNRRTAAIAAGGALAAAGLAAALLLAGDGDTTEEASHSGARAPGATTVTRREGRVFEIAGVRFRVFADPNQRWTRALRRSPAGPGLRWQTVALLYRNLARGRLVPIDLRLRLEDGRRRVYAPDPLVGNRGTDLPPTAAVPQGTLVHGQLAFRVPDDAEDLALVFNATPRRRVRVPLRTA